MAKTVFYSFHYGRDVHRVQLIRNFHALEGQPLLNAQDWEKVRRGGDRAIENWIDEQMRYKRAVIVLIGNETATRPWVQYEIEKAWKERKPLLGIRIHGLSSMGVTDRPGLNPFDVAGLRGARIPVFDPTRSSSQGTHAHLRSMLPTWSEQGVRRQ